jgi:hypothetical protein
MLCSWPGRVEVRAPCSCASTLHFGQSSRWHCHGCSASGIELLPLPQVAHSVKAWLQLVVLSGLSVSGGCMCMPPCCIIRQAELSCGPPADAQVLCTLGRVVDGIATVAVLVELNCCHSPQAVHNVKVWLQLVVLSVLRVSEQARSLCTILLPLRLLQRCGMPD